MLPKHSIDNVLDKLFFHGREIPKHPPKILFLYGSLRERSYSRLLAEEAGHIVSSFGAETRFFNPVSLPLADISLTQTTDFEKLPGPVKELRHLVDWCEAMVWVSPEVHGNISSILKNQID